MFLTMQGPFDTFLVGGDTAEVSGMKFSNDGKLMLLSTTSGHVYVVDAYSGRKVRTSVLFWTLLCATVGARRNSQSSIFAWRIWFMDLYPSLSGEGVAFSPIFSCRKYLRINLILFMGMVGIIAAWFHTGTKHGWWSTGGVLQSRRSICYIWYNL